MLVPWTNANSNLNLSNKIAESLLIMFEVYISIGLVLFYTFGSLIAAHFQNLRSEIECYAVNTYDTHWPQIRIESSVDDRLKQWKLTYSKLFEIVHHFQRCFEPVLLVWIVFASISFINISFYLLYYVSFISQDVKGIWAFILFLTRNAFNILIVTAVPVNIHAKVCMIFNFTNFILFKSCLFIYEFEVTWHL